MFDALFVVLLQRLWTPAVKAVNPLGDWVWLGKEAQQGWIFEGCREAPGSYL